MKGRRGAKPGFTLVEMIVVIVMMGILAAAGLIGFGGMVSHFRQQSCIASRKEAAQAYVSDWMEGDIPDPQRDEWNDWLAAYRAANHTEHSEKWSVKVAQNGTRYTVRVHCSEHWEEDVELTFGPPALVG